MSRTSHARVLDFEWEQELPGGRYVIPGFTESESKALWMVNEFEVGGGNRLVFWGLSGDFDNMGISFGIAQWNIGAGSLQPLLREFDRTHPDKFARIFGDGTARMRQMLALDENKPPHLAQQLAFVRTFVTGNAVHPPWKGRLEALGQDPDFQDQMLRKLRGLMDSAVRAAQALGFRSERALALCFDIHIWPGPYWFKLPRNKPRQQFELPQSFAREEQRRGAPLSEHDKLLIVAARAAAGASNKWRQRATERKRLIVEPGPYKGRQRDLEADYGIGDAPFTHNLGGKVPTGASLQLPRRSSPSPSSSSAPSGYTPGLTDFARLVPERMQVITAFQRGTTDPNALANELFFTRHPNRRGTKIQPYERALAAEWLYLREQVVKPALASMPASAPSPTPPPTAGATGPGGFLSGVFGTVSNAVSSAGEAALVIAQIGNGVRDSNHLTNVVFWRRHPDRKDTRLQPHEKDLAAEWLSIRDTVVRPLIANLGAAPSSTPQPGGSPSAWPDAPVAPPTPGAGDKVTRQPPPAAITVSPLAQMAWKLRGVTKTRGRKVNSVVVHTTGRGWMNRERTRPPLWHQLKVYLDSGGGYPHYVIDYDGSIIVTADEDNEAWHAGWSNVAKPYWKNWSAPWWWSQAWGAQGKRTPMDLLPPGARTPNTTSIGIELLPTAAAEYTDAQLRSLAKLIADIERRHGFQVPFAPSPQLLGHEDVNPLPMAQSGRAYDNGTGGWDPGAHGKKPKFSWPRLWGYLLKARQGGL